MPRDDGRPSWSSRRARSRATELPQKPLRYRLDDLGVVRMSRIDDDELAVVKLALERSGKPHPLDPVDQDALRRIRPHLHSLFNRP